MLDRRSVEDYTRAPPARQVNSAWVGEQIGHSKADINKKLQRTYHRQTQRIRKLVCGVLKAVLVLDQQDHASSTDRRES